MKQPSKEAGLVYSSAAGRICPDCEQPVTQCLCRKKTAPAPADGVVRLMRETKGRKGKGVTLIRGLPLEGDALKKLAKALKQKCGSGGSVKDGTLEIQGDQRDLVEKELISLGYRVKRAGA